MHMERYPLFLEAADIVKEYGKFFMMAVKLSRIATPPKIEEMGVS